MFGVESSGMARKDLDKVSRCAGKVAKARDDLRDAIVAAHLSGESIRDIAQVAGVSATKVHELLREAKAGEQPPDRG